MILGWYSSGSFYLMKSISESLPLIPIVMCHVYICNIYEDVKPGIYWQLVAMITLGGLAFQAIAHVFSLISNGNMPILTTVSVGMFLLFQMLNNFFISIARLHYVYRFIASFSISRFVFESAILLQYGFKRCRHKEIQQFLYLMKLEDVDLFHCIRMLVVNLIIYHLISIWMLVNKSNSMDNRRQRCERLETYQEKIIPSNSIGLNSNHTYRVEHFQI